ncbi:2-hydroxy-6-oxo-6-phenylhexa-2,4-dienoate hydrolase [Rhodococcus opacus PD630]|uniref:alpha/beta fold hydrolase n=1 Tax=Rhodococcus opacus TaxID=37919 RepID=UPI00029CC47D|nr:alpha/beta fold hydrolase [Rhodococcus opacus]KXF55634.1 alpha/beta hydrolase [Rhodococcus sp. SC4]RZK84923.1 MAG: alpha/beta fold hydrolase [Rhodococcus sp. (in: high G+C Gram-positive bacteria)]AHK29639.1 4,5-9,10-diseco-3-hydroxy-5,9,17-trioxoandrosta-1(10),2-diene-4-oate hydrolase [Rhodococcus opacus PD630]EHI45972.1 2-hydroxy-6-oxo-6-phenylhexa-2,4-dienoate hydrolase [Rhodococcus opacus PD630]UDG99390.1 alpha/beta fold hydrolase [Rhodococcus opacus PD630]
MTTDSSYEGTLKELKTDLGVLRYHEAGDGPPLLLLHGSGPGVTGWRNFRGNLGVFAEHFRTFVLEFPGFGVSDDFGGHPMLTAGDAVLRFLDGLGLDEVAMLGNSMGGIVATQFAIAHPDRVGKLITIGGIGRNLFSPGPGEGINLLMEFTDDPTRERLIAWLHSMVFDPAMVTEELIEERWTQATDPETLASARKMYSKAAFEAGAKAALESDTTPYWAQLHKVKAPTLLTWGRDDRVSPLDMAIIPMRSIPRAELHVFPNCGHWAMIEQKTAFESAVLAFLLRKDGSGR